MSLIKQLQVLSLRRRKIYKSGRLVELIFDAQGFPSWLLVHPLLRRRLRTFRRKLLPPGVNHFRAPARDLLEQVQRGRHQLGHGQRHGQGLVHQLQRQPGPRDQRPDRHRQLNLHPHPRFPGHHRGHRVHLVRLNLGQYLKAFDSLEPC